MNKLFYLISSIIIILGVISCNSAKNVAYIQGAGENDMAGYVQTGPMYDARILPKDLLTITVSATDPEAVKPFNLTVPSLTTGSSTYSLPAGTLFAYQDDKGQRGVEPAEDYSTGTGEAAHCGPGCDEW
jgi:polysaccharide export outer membrane protein